MSGRGFVEEHAFTICDELNLLVHLCDSGIGVHCVVDTTLLVHLPVVQSQLVGEQDDIDVLTFLAQIGDGGNVFSLHTLLIEHNEMLIAYMGRTNVSGILVVVCALNETTRDIFQPLYCF